MDENSLIASAGLFSLKWIFPDHMAAESLKGLWGYFVLSSLNFAIAAS